MLQRFFCMVGVAFLLCVTVFAQDDTAEGYIAPVPVDQLAILTLDNISQMQPIGAVSDMLPAYGVLSPDERWWAAPDQIGIWLYDTSDWAKLPRLLEYLDVLVNGTIAFSADSSVLLAGCKISTLCAWSVATGQRLATMTSPNVTATRDARPGIVLSRDATKVLLVQMYSHGYSFRYSAALFHIQAQDGQFSATEVPLHLDETLGYPRVFSFTPDNERVFVQYVFEHENSDAYALYRGGFYDANTGQPVATPLDTILTAEPFFSAYFTSDGQFLVVERAGQFLVVDAGDGSIKQRITHSSEEPNYAFAYYKLSPDGQLLVVSERESDLARYRFDIWELATGKQRTHFEMVFTDFASVYEYNFTSDSQGIVTRSGELNVAGLGLQTRVEWDTTTGEPRLPRPQPDDIPTELLRTQFQAYESSLFVDSDLTLCKRRWYGAVLAPAELCTFVTDLELTRYSDNLRWVVGSGSFHGVDFFLRDTTGSYTTRQIRHSPTIVDIAFMPATSRFVTATSGVSSYKGVLRLWDAESGKVVQAFGEVAGNYTQIQFSADGRYLAASYYGNTSNCSEMERYVTVFTTSSFRPVYTLEPYSNPLLFTTDGENLIAGAWQLGSTECGFTSSLHLLDAATGEVVREYLPEEAENRFVSAALNADETLLAGGTEQGWVYVWDFASGKLLFKHKLLGAYVNVQFTNKVLFAKADYIYHPGSQAGFTYVLGVMQP